MSLPARRRSWALGLALLGFAELVAPPSASAALRVHDAPRAALPRGKGEAVVPPAPPEYLTEDLGWIELAYHPSTRERVRPVIAQAGAIRAELGALLGREVLTSPVKVRIAALPAELDNLSPVELGGTATAASFGALRLAIMSAAPRLSLDPPRLDVVFRHALAHLALDEATGGAALPRWLHEGFAVHAAGDHAALRAQTLCLASLKGRLVPLAELDTARADEEAPTSLGHAEGADFVRFLLEPERRQGFSAALTHLGAGAPLEDALAKAYGSDARELELAWRGNVARRYGVLPVLLGSLLALGLLIAGVLAVRRLWLRKPSPPPPRRRPRAEPEPRARGGRIATARLVAARGARPRPDGDGDAEVPKVEHNGQWHTLH